MMGLPRPEALEFAAQSESPNFLSGASSTRAPNLTAPPRRTAMQGAARMVLQTGIHPAALKDSVTTPGGCTIAGLLALEDGRVRSTVARCIQVTSMHAAGLGKGPAPVLKE